MNRYRGKRETPRPEREFDHRGDDPLQQDPFLCEGEESGVPPEAAVLPPEEPLPPVGDPFAVAGTA